MARPRISLCMIVRDEEALLPACLDSVRGAVDELVVVDTGSRDATREVARRAGARVLDFTWVDDFAAARNHGLSHARGQWVLVLDADERLTPRSGAGLRAAVTGATFDCGMIRLHEAARIDAPFELVLSGQARLSEAQLVPRLLRRTDHLSFVQPVHENVLPWLRRRGMKVSGVDADIVHLGATAEIVQGKGKAVRNERLLLGRITSDPHDVEAYGYLAHEYLRVGRADDAHRLVEQGWSQIRQGTEAAVGSLHRLATARSLILVGASRYTEARQTVEVARAAEGESPDLVFLTAYANESEAMSTTGAAREALLSAACEGYRRCLTFRASIFAQSFIVGASSWYGATRLGTVLLLLERPAEAEEAFELALRDRPAERAPALGRAEACVLRGDPRAGLQQIEPLLDASPDGWILAALAAEALGHGGDARLFAARARQAAPRGFVAGHRRDVLRLLLDRIAA